MDVLPATYDGPPILSASQIGVWKECQRKWGWQYVAHLPRPQGPGAALGERTHRQLELYLLEGRPLQFTTESGEEDESGYLAAEALPHLPAPKTPGLEVESKRAPGDKREGFYFSSPRTGIIYHGFIDWRLPGDVPTVGDHKTTSSISQWALTADELKTDDQAILYSVDTMSKFQVPRVRLQWTYMQTRGARKSLPVIVELDSEHVAREFAKLETVAVQIATTLYQVNDSWDDSARRAFVEALTPNPGACRNYGGCPYTSVCNLGPRDFWRSKPGPEAMSNINSDLINRLRGQGAPPPAAAPMTQSASETAELPEWATAKADPLLSRLKGQSTTPGQAAKAVAVAKENLRNAVIDQAAAQAGVPINPPGEYQPPPTAEQRDTMAAEAPKKRGRPRKTPDAPPAVLSSAQPSPYSEPTKTVTNTGSDGEVMRSQVPAAGVEPLVDALFVDCIPVTAEEYMPGALLVHEASKRVTAITQKADYRFLEYGQGPGALLAGALEYLEEQSGLTSVAIDTRTPEGAILCNELMARAVHVVRGLR